MDWLIWVPVAVAIGIYLWRQAKNRDKAEAASARLEKDARLFRRIKTGMREYNWRNRQNEFWKAKDGDLLFETAHISAFEVSHRAESRVGFYFKDLQEYGMYGFFVGNDGEHIESYYRSDRTFKKEEVLLAGDDSLGSWRTH